MGCSEVTRLSGAVLDSTTGAAIDISRITREVDGLRSPCCEPCDPYVRASTSMVAVARAVDAAPLPLAAPPDGRNINTLRQVPYIKARVGTCDAIMRPLFFDAGQSLVVPWCDASLAIVVPDIGWVVNPALDQPIPLVGGGGRNIVYDVWLWSTLVCTKCCPDKTATLTDSRLLAASPTVNVIAVPPGAKRATLYLRAAAGGTFTATWHASADPTAAVLGRWSMGSAAFADYSPKNMHVVPGASHLRVVADVVAELTLAWEVQP